MVTLLLSLMWGDAYARRAFSRGRVARSLKSISRLVLLSPHPFRTFLTSHTSNLRPPIMVRGFITLVPVYAHTFSCSLLWNITVAP